MRDTSQNNAMAEIALALAMGFFSIMVLTMVSMGGGAATSPGPDIEAGVVVRASAEAKEGAAATKDMLVIHYEGRFLDLNLKPLDPAALSHEGPMILAVAPGMTFDAVMRVRAQAATPDITVTTLNQKWLATLKETFK